MCEVDELLEIFSGRFLLSNHPAILQVRVNYICKILVAFDVQADCGTLTVPHEIVSSQFSNILSLSRSHCTVIIIILASAFVRVADN